MENTRELNAGDAAALLCYLAVCELAVMALQGASLTTADLVESSRIWLARNCLSAGWLERVTLAQRAGDVVKQVVHQGRISPEKLIPQRMFVDATTVNYEDPLVARVWKASLDAVGEGG
ncbi:hypothetical protein B0G76_6736 [Paraburkholderia sp. BL23I1N1]|uniref:hypothetical protein n=1 Tax=Paraburkholderia sp. BL23I1N1 TaxID=1938802 RepID=UPI000E72263B|nr:hypothetical protein [Paraburkholderia sp. BL23I1N1]RKE25212.1 hypothetical protein B0G76_6736 [Paraburkholderia sp. BL23I1N1]